MVFVLYITFVSVFNLFSGACQLSSHDLITFCGLIITSLKFCTSFLSFLPLFLKESMLPLTSLKWWTTTHVNSASVLLGSSVLLQIADLWCVLFIHNILTCSFPHLSFWQHLCIDDGPCSCHGFGEVIKFKSHNEVSLILCLESFTDGYRTH